MKRKERQEEKEGRKEEEAKGGCEIMLWGGSKEKNEKG